MAKPPPPKPPKTQRPPPGLPDRDTLIKYLRTAGEQDKGDIARAFGLKGEGRRARLAPAKGEAVIGAPGMGDRVLVHFDRLETGEYEARLIKKLGQSAHRILGVIRKANREIRVEPVDRKSKESLVLSFADGEKLRDGDLVLATVGAQVQRYGLKHGKLVEVVGREDEPRAASL